MTRGIIFRKHRHVLIVLFIFLVIFPLPTKNVKACSAAITVANLHSSGPGSLKQAFADICAGGTITFAPSLNGGTIYATSNPGFNITTNLTIQGLEDPPGITIDGAGIGTVFYNNLGYTTSLSYLTIQHGGGSGIINRGTLTLDHVNVTNNSGADGGGIDNWGTLNISYSTISNNTASSRGGGIYNTNAGTLTIENSTISGNSCGTTGGIYQFSGSVSMKNVTISSNSGSGFYTYNNTHSFTNSIVSGNGIDLGCDWASTINSFGHNMIRTIQSGCPITDLGGGTDQNGTPGGAAGPDPLLGALADNGGFTKTHALNTGSPAIDMGCTAAPADDQRGVTRALVGTGICDPGSFEAGAVLPVTTGCSASTAVITGLNTIEVTFNTDMENGGTSHAADNKDNYLLVEAGANRRIDTATCRAGVAGDDAAQTISIVVYDNGGGAGPYISTVTLANPLDGTKGYSLFACGTSSIWSAVGLKLNSGRSDGQFSFGSFHRSRMENAGGEGGTTSEASALPGTGFAPGETSVLPVVPPGKDYSGLDLMLDIPKLKVKAPVVGVPRTGYSWDVTWLGRQAGYLEGSAFPTWDGNSVLTGHVWDADNSPGIFVDLKKLKYGDKVNLRAFGKVYTYEVREAGTLRGSQVKTAFKHENIPWLTLVTCEDYREERQAYALRRMVRAVLTTVTAEIQRH